MSDTSRGRKGGTLIAEQVRSLARHEEMMKDPASYRPGQCRCGCTRLHLHDRRERRARGTVTGESGSGVVTVAIFRCAECSATWRVLPGLLARCLWHTWEVVGAAMFGDRRHEVPARTVQRWHARLAQAALAASQALAASGNPLLRAVAQQLGLDGTRGGLVAVFAAATGAGSPPLAPLAALLHRLSPGLRLM